MECDVHGYCIFWKAPRCDTMYTFFLCLWPYARYVQFFLIGAIPLCYVNTVVYWSVFKHNIYHKMTTINC